ncbi:MAG TPA: response regulator transcription factor [Burkholderiaceae bacterium]|nr:response regulator transcription factor [Burkholderiaceae bacterium]
MNVAILDDDPYQRRLLTMLAESGGHRVHAYETGESLLEALDAGDGPDLLLLDWVMPGMSGEAVLGALRARPGPELPVIVVTARDGEADVVGALRLGADDYVVKPPKGLELLARIEALARRARIGRAVPLRAGRFEVDLARRAVLLDGREIVLTLKEFDLASHLFRNPGTLVTRAQLLEAVWSVGPQLDTRTVDTHASRVRRKLGLDGSRGWMLQSVYGYGYRLVPA